ncbi:unnamed protein product [Symbiodinium natans]|uniref:Uncharacterized protein n=1 Tax=Symbiodinium natans TaxID=878477 RepID=A0A812QX47_9DINO|nr:unnamed protein product [Symbiodinium natans]
MAQMIRGFLEAKGIQARSRQELSAGDPFLSSFDIESASFESFLDSVQRDATSSHKAKLVHTLERLAVVSEMVQERVEGAETERRAGEDKLREGMDMLCDKLTENEDMLLKLEMCLVVAEKAIRERTGSFQETDEPGESEEEEDDEGEEEEEEASGADDPEVTSTALPSVQGLHEEEEEEDLDEPASDPPPAIPVPGAGMQVAPGHVPGAAGAMIGESLDDDSDAEEPEFFWRGRVAPLART